MGEKPVRHRRRHGAGGQQTAGTLRRPSRRRRRKRLAFRIRAAALELGQLALGLGQLALELGRLARRLARRMIAWGAERGEPIRQALLSRLSPPPRRRRRRRVVWKVGAAEDGRWRKAAARGIAWAARRRTECMAALLAVCGIVMLAAGCRGMVRFVRDARQSQRTGEAVLALYAPVSSPDAAEIRMAEKSPTETPLTETSATGILPIEIPPTEMPTPEPMATEPPKEKRFFTLDGPVRPELAALAQTNGDLVGWLRIEQVVNQPVLYRDNVYYETHDFYGSESVSGAIFLDYGHRLTPETQNILLHGHNMKDGTMFGMLLRYYKDGDFLRRHGIVHFDTLYEEGTYAIFAVLDVSLNRKDARYFDYFSHARFSDADEQSAYVAAVRERSLYDVPIDVRPEDALLTLSTCLGEDRLVILSRRLRAGESEEELRALLAGARKK